MLTPASVALGPSAPGSQAPVPRSRRGPTALPLRDGTSLRVGHLRSGCRSSPTACSDRCGRSGSRAVCAVEAGGADLPLSPQRVTEISRPAVERSLRSARSFCQPGRRGQRSRRLRARVWRRRPTRRRPAGRPRANPRRRTMARAGRCHRTGRQPFGSHYGRIQVGPNPDASERLITRDNRPNPG